MAPMIARLCIVLSCLSVASLAACSGGLSFAPGQNVKAVLRMVLDDLHSGYVLTYELPGHSTGQHSVRIRAE